MFARKYFLKTEASYFFPVVCVRYRGMPVVTCLRHVITPDRLTWKEARDECRRRDHDLLSIQDEEQMHYVHTRLLHTTYSEDDRLVYIGNPELVARVAMNIFQRTEFPHFPKLVAKGSESS